MDETKSESDPASKLIAELEKRAATVRGYGVLRVASWELLRVDLRELELLLDLARQAEPLRAEQAKAVEEEREAVRLKNAGHFGNAPPWLSDAAEALGCVRKSDGAPLCLNWTQVIEGIRDLREDRDQTEAAMRVLEAKYRDTSASLAALRAARIHPGPRKGEGEQ